MIVIAKIIAESVYNDRNTTLPVHCKVDNKSLCETAKTIKRISDISLQVDMLIVQEMIEKEGVTFMNIVSSWQTHSQRIAH